MLCIRTKRRCAFGAVETRRVVLELFDSKVVGTRNNHLLAQSAMREVMRQAEKHAIAFAVLAADQASADTALEAAAMEIFACSQSKSSIADRFAARHTRCSLSAKLFGVAYFVSLCVR